ncbi:hypothetical protein NUW54_g10112 [Trametes sanguinea]|uniref:Uncharacterized protein n=1 Tax=Trametes sanguinea TaxID=158606 RepID=A0ACC1P1F1_9APHY|nr:hypothetical protein NUW54_g10112 [Trametes sanguinea]
MEFAWLSRSRKDSRQIIYVYLDRLLHRLRRFSDEGLDRLNEALALHPSYTKRLEPVHGFPIFLVCDNTLLEPTRANSDEPEWHSPASSASRLARTDLMWKAIQQQREAYNEAIAQVAADHSRSEQWVATQLFRGGRDVAQRRKKNLYNAVVHDLAKKHKEAGRPSNGRSTLKDLAREAALMDYENLPEDEKERLLAQLEDDTRDAPVHKVPKKHVGDDRLDAVAFALDLGHQEGHAMVNKLVVDITTNVYNASSHIGEVLPLHVNESMRLKLSFVSRYIDWRSKHESSACTEDVGLEGSVTTRTFTLFPISLYFVFVEISSGHMNCSPASPVLEGGRYAKRRSNSVGEKYRRRSGRNSRTASSSPACCAARKASKVVVVCQDAERVSIRKSHTNRQASHRGPRSSGAQIRLAQPALYILARDEHRSQSSDVEAYTTRKATRPPRRREYYIK